MGLEMASNDEMERHDEVKKNKWGVPRAVLIVFLMTLSLLILFFWQRHVIITIEKGKHLFEASLILIYFLLVAN